MAYKLEKISHFEAKRMIQYLEQSNDGKGDYNENRITLRIQDKMGLSQNEVKKSVNYKIP